MSSYLFKNCKFIFVDSNPHNIATKKSLLTVGNVIYAIDDIEELEAKYPDLLLNAKIIDCENKIVMPGLVDAHNHLCNTHMNLSRAFLIDYANIDKHMLTTVHDPYGWLTDETFYDISLASAVNAIKHGATTLSNATIKPHLAYEVMQESGLRGILAAQIATSFRLRSDDLSPNQMLERTENNIKDYHDPQNGKMSIVVHIHDFWDTLEDIMLRGMALAEKYDTKYVSHFWEFQDALEKSDAIWADEGGAYERYASLGLINDRCVFFHGSMLDEKTIDKLSLTGASIIHNPDINGTNCGNCAYIPYMLSKGINVGIGSDYGSLDVLTAMKLMLYGHNIMPRDLKGVDSTAPFHAATMGGAKAYGLEDLIGTLEIGKRADIITFDLSTATELLPMSTSLIDTHPDLLYFIFTRNCTGLQTVDTLVDGNPLRLNGEFIELDEEKITHKAVNCIDQFLPDMISAHEDGVHYYKKIHDNFIRDEDLSEALFKELTQS